MSESNESVENTNDKNHTWDILKCAFKKILHKSDSSSNYSITELYEYSYEMVTNNQSEELYNGLKELITEYLQNNAREVILNSSRKTFLCAFCNIWEDFETAIHSISRILVYLDRTHKANKNNIQVDKMSKKLFCDQILYYNNHFHTIQTMLFEMINDEMDGHTVNRGAIKRILSMFMSIESNLNINCVLDNPSIFNAKIKEKIVKTFTTFIDAEGEKCFDTATNTFAYIDAAESIIAREWDRINYYYDCETQHELRSIMCNKLVGRYMHKIVEMEGTNLTYMFDNNKHEDLSRIFSFLNHISFGYISINHYLHLHIRELGKIIVQDTNINAADLLQSLIDLKNKCDNFANCLKDNGLFLSECEESFIYIMRLNPDTIKLLTKCFINQLNAYICPGEPDSHKRTVIENTMKMAGYIEKREFFEDSCKQFMANIFLKKIFDKSDLNDIEVTLTSILEPFCSRKFNRNVNNMFNDIMVNKTLMEEFKQYTSQSNERYMNSVDELNVGLLSKADWPIYVRMSGNLPSVLTNAYDNFLKFYKKNHARRLTCLPNVGIAYLKATFYGSPQSDDKSVSPKEYTIEASTFQTCVLLLFNNKDKLTLKTILKETDISERRLIKILQSLTSKKPLQSSILLKNPPDTKFEHNDEFYINEAFSSESDKVSILLEETNFKKLFNNTAKKHTVVSENDIKIKSSIVSIMESEKIITHIKLVNEVEKENIQLRPEKSLTVIQNQIDRLIEEKRITISVYGSNSTYVST